MPGSSAEHSMAAKGGSSSQLKSWLSGLGKKGKGDLDEVGCLICLSSNMAFALVRCDVPSE